MMVYVSLLMFGRCSYIGGRARRVFIYGRQSCLPFLLHHATLVYSRLAARVCDGECRFLTTVHQISGPRRLVY